VRLHCALACFLIPRVVMGVWSGPEVHVEARHRERL
jgi:hypothetical protein